MGGVYQLEFILNSDRLSYLLERYGFSTQSFLDTINHAIKKSQVWEEQLNRIFAKQGKVSLQVLKRIDKVFEKGLTWYISRMFTYALFNIHKEELKFSLDVS